MGSFRGVGPRNYRRSDERIREEVCECLTEDPRINATNIDVTVKDCEVTLSGNVNSRDQKRRAEDLAESISGVKDVHNTLKVSAPPDREAELRNWRNQRDGDGERKLQ
jgi:osmotically-inducible protein OsmY